MEEIRSGTLATKRTNSKTAFLAAPAQENYVDPQPPSQQSASATEPSSDMNQTIRRDASLALLLTTIGLIALIFGADLSMGRIDRMGAGYVPWLVACGILLLSACIGVRTLYGWRQQTARTVSADEARPPVPWRAVISISLSAISFALFIRPTGLLIATIIMVLICTLAQNHSGWHARLLVAGFLAAFAGLLFSVGLGLPISLFPTS
jgi:hypothetical protein